MWIALCLILAIVQIGILPVSIGVIVYIWAAGDTTTAILLTIWMLLVGISDNILKPIVMGKGAPMLVIFIRCNWRIYVVRGDWAIHRCDCAVAWVQLSFQMGVVKKCIEFLLTA